MTHLSRRGFLGASSAATTAAAYLFTGATPGPQEGAEGSTEDEAAAQESTDASGAITIASASAPASLDPGLATDTETERICRQIFEPLVGIDKDTGNVSPLLASDWEVSSNGQVYTFALRRGVTFHDGSELDAEVVVQNFQRWGRLDYLYGTNAMHRSTPLAFPSVFGGFMGSADCVLESVEALDERTVELRLSEPVVYLLQALTLPAFGIISGELLTDIDPTRVDRAPAGTGPYELAERENGAVALEAFSSYWGSNSGPERVVVQPLPKSFDRLRELQRGAVDVYDYITADNLRSLVQAGRLYLQRDPFSVLYMGINTTHPILSDFDIRRAAARAIDRHSLVDQLFLDGSRAAFQFTPAALAVHSDDAVRHSYNPQLAQELLEESDYDGEPLDFYYPITTTRSYLPRPEAVFASVAADLTAAGFNIRPRPVPWDEGYVDQMLNDSDRAFHLLGRNGGFRSPHSFFAPLFRQPNREFNFTNETVNDLLDSARAEDDEEQRTTYYQQVADELQEQLPAVPLAYPISALALGSSVRDYPMSPVLNERFADIELTET